MTAVTFAGAKGKTSAVGAVLDAVAGASGDGIGAGYNGTVNGHKGFGPGNKYGALRHKGVLNAQKGHTAAKNAAAKAVKAHGKARTKASASAVARATRTAAAAHRELEAARASRAAEKAASKPAKAPKPAATVAPRVERSAKATSDTLAANAHRKIDELKAGLAAGTHDADAITTHVDRIARGATKAELFDAAKRAGIAHDATTKRALVDHLKNHAFDHKLAADKAREMASKPAEVGPGAARVERASAAAKAGKVVGADGVAVVTGYKAYAKDAFPGLESRLSAAEVAAVKHYKSFAFDATNTALRGERRRSLPINAYAPHHADSEAGRNVRNLDAAIAKGALPEDTVLYRGIKLRRRQGDDAASVDRLVGRTIGNAGFLSTTTSPATARSFGSNKKGSDHDVFLRITAPKGTPAIPVDAVRHDSHQEQEMLLGRGHQLKITGITTVGKHKFFEATLVPAKLTDGVFVDPRARADGRSLDPITRKPTRD